MPLVYDELREIAGKYLRGERAGHTLQPTALVNEAYLRLVQLHGIEWEDRVDFLAAAAGTIRRVLVDHARARRAGKRGGDRRRFTLTDLAAPEASLIDLLALEDALVKLAGHDEAVSRVVELRFFGGLTIAQTAGIMGIGITTVKEKWDFARTWLRREIEGRG